MRLARSILVVILALLFVPLTSHCKLESVSGFEFLRCSPESGGPESHDDHPCDAGCCPVEFSKYQIQRFEEIVPADDSSPEPFCPRMTVSAALPWLERGTGAPTVDPPEPLRPWQFSLRAACPPRAPGSAS
jgi:hypothetical protein